MNRTTIRTNIRNNLDDAEVYRTDTFINDAIDDGVGLVSLFTLCDERRSSVNVDGNRNFNPVPASGTAYCVAPLFVANSNTGYRLAPCKAEQFEMYDSEWEGQVGTDGGGMYYTYVNPYHSAHATIVCCPQQNIGRTQLTVVGAYVPSALGSDTASPRFDDSFHDLLVLYGTFYCLVSEPGMGSRAGEFLGQFIARMNTMTASIRARFPSGRDYEPHPVEFTYENITEQERRAEESSEGK